MHHGGAYVNKLIAAMAGGSAKKSDTRAAATALNLNLAQANTLRTTIEKDAQDYYYSACLSVVDGIRGLNEGFYTWATVKLYYSVFYSLRAALAADRICTFYVDSSPFYILSAVGSSGKKGSGPTHSFVLDLFASINPSHPFATQTIDWVPALQWLIRRREDCNYRNSRFSEPDAPGHFQNVENYGVRRLVETYLSDDSGVYTFDKDHAMLAVPIAAMIYAGSLLKHLGPVQFSTEELALLTTECRDNHGPLPQMCKAFRELAE